MGRSRASVRPGDTPVTPEEKTVIDAAMKWHYAILADPSAIPFMPMSGPALALEGISRATRALATSCPECNAGGHHTASDCGEHDLLEYPLGKRISFDVMAKRARADTRTLAHTFPCWECLVDPNEDPAPWCDCRPEERASETHLTLGGPCHFRAHSVDRCPNKPNIADAGEIMPMSVENPETDPPVIDVSTFPCLDVASFKDDDPVWVESTLLFCLAGDRIRIGHDETDVLRSSSGAWHANVVSSVLPSGKTWDKVSPWAHTKLRLDLSANPGFQEYPPNLPCEILCNPERWAVLALMSAFPGTTEVK